MCRVAGRLLHTGSIISYQPHDVAFRLLPPCVIAEEQIDAFVGAFEAVDASANG